MCGIVGYIGPREAAPILLEGLRRLEYRGYDSAGIALVTDGEMFVEKRAGKLANLRTALADRTPSAVVGLAHTRWATHGRPNDLNAHPAHRLHRRHHRHPQRHHRELQGAARRLEARGHEPSSPRPTPRRSRTSIEEAYDGDTAEATRGAGQAHGAYAVAVMHRAEPDRLVGARMNVPLIVGIGEGENFLASDVVGRAAHTRRVIFLEEGDVADITRVGVTVTGVDGRRASAWCTTSTGTIETAEKGGFAHFMLKEMHEQPEAIRAAITGRVHDDVIELDDLEPVADG